MVVAATALALPGCGTILGSMGASDQAERDLAPRDEGVGHPRKDAAADREPESPQCAVLVNNVVVEGGCVTALNAEGVATGSWKWISEDGQMSPNPVSGFGGGWVWVTSDGYLVSVPSDGAAGVGKHGWYWVSPTGAVTAAPTSAGGWFWLADPSQVSATPVPGSFWVPAPGTSSTPGGGPGWYYVPSSDTALGTGPVTGGSGAVPIVPAITPPGASSSSGSGGSSTVGSAPGGAGSSGATLPGSGPLCAPGAGVIGSSGPTNGWIEVGTSCPSDFSWATSAYVDAASGAGFTVEGSATVVPESPAAAGVLLPQMVQVSIDVGMADPSSPRITDLRSSPPNPAFSYSDSVMAPAGDRCPSGGVTIAVRGSNTSSSQQPSATIVICDAVLAQHLLGL